MLRPYVGEDKAAREARAGRLELIVAEEELLGPLPAGRHGFSREQVAHNQRERLIAGLRHRRRRARLQRGHDHPHHQGRRGLPPRLLRELRGQGGVLPRRFRRRRRRTSASWSPRRSSRRRTGRTRRSPPPARCSPSSPPSPTWPASAWSSPRAPARRSRPASTTPCASWCRRWSGGGRSAAGERDAAAEHRGLDDRRPRLPRQPQGRRRRSRRLEDLLPDFTEFILSPYLGPDEAARLARQA